MASPPHCEINTLSHPRFGDEDAELREMTHAKQFWVSEKEVQAQPVMTNPHAPSTCRGDLELEVGFPTLCAKGSRLLEDDGGPGVPANSSLQPARSLCTEPKAFRWHPRLCTVRGRT